jgi:toxin YoeB
MKLQFHGASWDHYQHWVENDKTTLRKLNRLIMECQRHPYEGTGKPEALKGDFAGHWSRRIDREHRLVYRVEGDTLIIVQCRYHY